MFAYAYASASACARLSAATAASGSSAVFLLTFVCVCCCVFSVYASALLLVSVYTSVLTALHVCMHVSGTLCHSIRPTWLAGLTQLIHCVLVSTPCKRVGLALALAHCYDRVCSLAVGTVISGRSRIRLIHYSNQIPCSSNVVVCCVWLFSDSSNRGIPL